MNTKINVLKHGFVEYIDHMGSDQDIINTARICYDNVKSTEDFSLLRYLMRHRHTSPFESSVLKIRVRLPIFVERQFARHRTAGWNELSGRYSELPTDMETVTAYEWRLQSKKNRQGSEDTFDDAIGNTLSTRQATLHDQMASEYQHRLSLGVAKEQARIDMPVSTYTEKVWWCNLHNILHFLELRLDSHAQQEIQEYAKAMASIVQQLWPATYQAFMDYRLNAMTLTALDIEAIRYLEKVRLLGGAWGDPEESRELFSNKREHAEFLAKYEKLFFDVGVNL